MINFVGAAARRTDRGIASAATLVGCDVANLMADVQVEAASSGFDEERRPKALFEPHIFFRNLKGDRRDRAVATGLAYARWGAKPYPHDSYPRILTAMAIDTEAALRSTSWGLPQILGENHAAAGYSSAVAMVNAFVAGGEDEHLSAMAHFIVANPRMREALIARDWATYAHLYNGPATKGYDTRLAAAYAQQTAIHPAALNDHLANTAAAKAVKADSAAGTMLAGGVLATAMTAASLPHTIVLVTAAVAIVVTAMLALRAIAFARKHTGFAALATAPSH